jgi:SAM-dependent methyltransferase
VSSPDPAQYDSFAAEFEDHAAEAAYNALYDRPATLRLLGAVDGLRVLDAGCGPGLYADELLARGARVTGCDASPQMIELARRRVGDRADLRVHSLDDPMPWRGDETVDVALCALAYHYVNDRQTFLGEMHRVLTPAGALVISTHHPTSDWVRLGGSYFDVRPVTETWRRGWTITAWRMPLTHLAGEFADAGFVIERLVEPTPDPAMAETYPDTFAKLSTEPGFICFRLRKRSG